MFGHPYVPLEVGKEYCKCKMFSGRAQYEDPGLLCTWNVIPVSPAALINKEKFIFIKKNVWNRPFPSSLVPLFQNESKCETFHMKMSSACSFIFMQIKVIFVRMVSHLDSLWNRGTWELGNDVWTNSQDQEREKLLSKWTFPFFHFLKLDILTKLKRKTSMPCEVYIVE